MNRGKDRGLLSIQLHVSMGYMHIGRWRTSDKISTILAEVRHRPVCIYRIM